MYLWVRGVGKFLHTSLVEEVRLFFIHTWIAQWNYKWNLDVYLVMFPASNQTRVL